MSPSTTKADFLNKLFGLSSQNQDKALDAISIITITLTSESQAIGLDTTPVGSELTINLSKFNTLLSLPSDCTYWGVSSSSQRILWWDLYTSDSISKDDKLVSTPAVKFANLSTTQREQLASLYPNTLSLSQVKTVLALGTSVVANTSVSSDNQISELDAFLEILSNTSATASTTPTLSGVISSFLADPSAQTKNVEVYLEAQDTLKELNTICNSFDSGDARNTLIEKYLALSDKATAILSDPSQSTSTLSTALSDTNLKSLISLLSDSDNLTSIKSLSSTYQDFIVNNAQYFADATTGKVNDNFTFFTSSTNKDINLSSLLKKNSDGGYDMSDPLTSTLAAAFYDTSLVPTSYDIRDFFVLIQKMNSAAPQELTDAKASAVLSKMSSIGSAIDDSNLTSGTTGVSTGTDTQATLCALCGLMAYDNYNGSTASSLQSIRDNSLYALDIYNNGAPKESLMKLIGSELSAVNDTFGSISASKREQVVQYYKFSYSYASSLSPLLDNYLIAGNNIITNNGETTDSLDRFCEAVYSYLNQQATQGEAVDSIAEIKQNIATVKEFIEDPSDTSGYTNTGFINLLQKAMSNGTELDLSSLSSSSAEYKALTSLIKYIEAFKEAGGATGISFSYDSAISALNYAKSFITTTSSDKFFGSLTSAQQTKLNKVISAGITLEDFQALPTNQQAFLLAPTTTDDQISAFVKCENVTLLNAMASMSATKYAFMTTTLSGESTLQSIFAELGDESALKEKLESVLGSSATIDTKTDLQSIFMKRYSSDPDIKAQLDALNSSNINDPATLVAAYNCLITKQDDTSLLSSLGASTGQTLLYNQLMYNSSSTTSSAFNSLSTAEKSIVLQYDLTQAKTILSWTPDERSTFLALSTKERQTVLGMSTSGILLDGSTVPITQKSLLDQSVSSVKTTIKLIDAQNDSNSSTIFAKYAADATAAISEFQKTMQSKSGYDASDYKKLQKMVDSYKADFAANFEKRTELKAQLTAKQAELDNIKNKYGTSSSEYRTCLAKINKIQSKLDTIEESLKKDQAALDPSYSSSLTAGVIVANKSATSSSTYKFTSGILLDGDGKVPSWFISGISDSSSPMNALSLVLASMQISLKNKVNDIAGEDGEIAKINKEIQNANKALGAVQNAYHNGNDDKSGQLGKDTVSYVKQMSYKDTNGSYKGVCYWKGNYYTEEGILLDSSSSPQKPTSTKLSGTDLTNFLNQKMQMVLGPAADRIITKTGNDADISDAERNVWSSNIRSYIDGLNTATTTATTNMQNLNNQINQITTLISTIQNQEQQALMSIFK